MLTFQDIGNIVKFLTAEIEDNFHLIVFKYTCLEYIFNLNLPKVTLKNINKLNCFVHKLLIQIQIFYTDTYIFDIYIYIYLWVRFKEVKKSH